MIKLLKISCHGIGLAPLRLTNLPYSHKESPAIIANRAKKLYTDPTIARIVTAKNITPVRVL